MKRIINKKILEKIKLRDMFYNMFLKKIVKELNENDDGLEILLSRKDISYYDKMLIAKELCSKNELVLWACKCAESVLHVYEETYGNIDKPRMCIDTTLTCSNRDVLRNAIKDAHIKMSKDIYSTYAAWSATGTIYALLDIRSWDNSAKYAIMAMDGRQPKEEQENKNIQLLVESIRDLKIMELT